MPSISIRPLLAMLVCSLLSACAILDRKDDVTGTPEVTATSYASGKAQNGVVLLDVNWGRAWGCADYRNAQLVAFSFDRMPLAPRGNDEPADFVVTTPGMLSAYPVFTSYAYQIPPGDYALSYVKIKIANSVDQVGYWVAGRSDFLKDGKSRAGSFRVKAGETVYIGNFALDCYQQPMLWRYYTKGKDDFAEHLAQYGAKYPFLDLSKVTYRLFDTKVIGHPYELK